MARATKTEAPVSGASKAKSASPEIIRAVADLWIRLKDARSVQGTFRAAGSVLSVTADIRGELVPRYAEDLDGPGKQKPIYTIPTVLIQLKRDAMFTGLPFTAGTLLEISTADYEYCSAGTASLVDPAELGLAIPADGDSTSESS